MIIVHDNDGRITGIHGIYPPDYQDLLTATGERFIEIDLNADAHEFSQQAYVANGELFQRPSIPQLVPEHLLPMAMIQSSSPDCRIRAPSLSMARIMRLPVVNWSSRPVHPAPIT